MSPEEIVRLECLKLAVGHDDLDPVSTVARARAYAEFVFGKENGRDA